MTDANVSYRTMAYNNGWANHRLLAAYARLSQSEFIAPRTGFFPSARATLNRILVVDPFLRGCNGGRRAWASSLGKPRAMRDGGCSPAGAGRRG
jgi:uncharacterized damage-inducible protein DinB